MQFREHSWRHSRSRRRALRPRAPSSAALKDLAPTGKLRVTFIVSNRCMSSRMRRISRPAIDLGRELANRLGVPFEPLGHPRASDIVASAKSGAWDLRSSPSIRSARMWWIFPGVSRGA